MTNPIKVTKRLPDLKFDRFEVDVLVEEASCNDCRAPLAKYAPCVMRQPHGKKYAFTTCRACAEKRIEQMAVVVAEAWETAPAVSDNDPETADS